MNTNQAITKKNFAPGTSRHTRSVHSLALRIAEELDLQMTEDEQTRRLAFAQRLRELRGVRSQQWVADRVGVTARAYQAWEAGGGIAGDNIEALAQVFKVDEDYLVYGNDRRPSPDQVTEMLDLLRRLEGRLTRIEDLLTEGELEDLEADVAPPKSPPADRRVSNDA